LVRPVDDLTAASRIHIDDDKVGRAAKHRRPLLGRVGRRRLGGEGVGAWGGGDWRGDDHSQRGHDQRCPSPKTGPAVHVGSPVTLAGTS
jgi:hypothetical protein